MGIVMALPGRRPGAHKPGAPVACPVVPNPRFSTWDFHSTCMRLWNLDFRQAVEQFAPVD